MQVVLIYKFERVLRSTDEWGPFRAFLQKHRCKLVSPTEDLTDESPSGRLKNNLLMSVAEYERLNTAEKIRIKLNEQANYWREHLADAPSLHNLPENPMTALMSDPARVVVFALVVMLAGGVREEIQRAFQLHRLSPGVMGRWPALVVTSVAFGFGHTVQGYDVAVATGLLGALWGALWLVRGSIVAPAVCHAVFNLGQVMAAWWVVRAGVSA